MKKKLVSIVLTLALLIQAAATVTVFADSTSRIEALVTVIQTIGREADALAETAENPFTDVPD